MTKEEFIKNERHFVNCCLDRPIRTRGEALFALIYDKAMRRRCKEFGINPVSIYTEDPRFKEV